MLKTCELRRNGLPLQRVFHSIRFKVNKVGVLRYSIFFDKLF